MSRPACDTPACTKPAAFRVWLGVAFVSILLCVKCLADKIGEIELRAERLK